MDAELSDYLAHRPLRLRATLDADEAYRDADFVLIATPTGYDEASNRFDTASVETVIGQVQAANPQATVVIKSTVPVGFPTVLELPAMIQLDVAESLPRNPHTQGDGQGEAPVRTAYRRAWNDRHATLPRLPFPQRPRPFAVPEGLQRHALGVEELLLND